MSAASAVASFAIVAGLLTITPGLDTALVLRAALAGGARRALLTGLGICSGAMVWGASAAVGVSALLTASSWLYTVLRYAGAAYLVWLGARLIWTGVIRRAPAADLEPSAPVDGIGAWASFSRGLMTNLLNPKVGAFYVAVLPQFLPEHASPVAMGLLLALVHDLETMLWFLLLILAAARMSRWLRRRSVLRAVDGGTGSVLVASGVALGVLAR